MVGKGTGLGLDTRYGIATKAGGHIEVETQLGEGTSFHVYLPIVDSVTDNDIHVDPERGNIAIGHETVLLVEDEALVKKACAVTLRNHGNHVLEASNGTKALRVVEENLDSSIGLLFTDVVMPFMGGVELSQKVIDAIPTVKVLFASGYSDEQTLSNVLTTKDHHFIQNPSRLTRWQAP